MSKYEYVSWKKNLFNNITGDKEPTKELIDELVANVLSPPINDFLDYQTSQYQRACLTASIDYRWENLRECIEDAKQAYLVGDIPLVCMFFVSLGRAIEAFEHPTREEKIAMLGAQLEKFNKESPLRIKNISQRALKTIAQSIAREKWKKDKEKKIRLGDMCQEVWSEIVDIAIENDLLKYRPDKVDGLKPWLREVAPDWARKRGAPKKAGRV